MTSGTATWEEVEQRYGGEGAIAVRYLVTADLRPLMLQALDADERSDLEAFVGVALQLTAKVIDGSPLPLPPVDVFNGVVAVLTVAAKLRRQSPGSELFDRDAPLENLRVRSR